MTDTVSETEVIFEVWQNGDMVAAADSLADAEHFMLVYGQDGPVEAKTAITTRFPGFNVDTAMLAASPQGEGSSGGVDTRTPVSGLSVWWLDNLAARRATLKASAPSYIRKQLLCRQGRNGRGRLWVDPMFGRLALPRLEGLDARPDDLPGGIVIKSKDAKYCDGGYVQLEHLVIDEQATDETVTEGVKP